MPPPRVQLPIHLLPQDGERITNDQVRFELITLYTKAQDAIRADSLDAYRKFLEQMAESRRAPSDPFSTLFLRDLDVSAESLIPEGDPRWHINRAIFRLLMWAWQHEYHHPGVLKAVWDYLMMYWSCMERLTWQYAMLVEGIPLDRNTINSIMNEMGAALQGIHIEIAHVEGTLRPTGFELGPYLYPEEDPSKVRVGVHGGGAYYRRGTVVQAGFVYRPGPGGVGPAVTHNYTETAFHFLTEAEFLEFDRILGGLPLEEIRAQAMVPLNAWFLGIELVTGILALWAGGRVLAVPIRLVLRSSARLAWRRSAQDILVRDALATAGQAEGALLTAQEVELRLAAGPVAASTSRRELTGLLGQLGRAQTIGEVEQGMQAATSRYLGRLQIVEGQVVGTPPTLTLSHLGTFTAQAEKQALRLGFDTTRRLGVNTLSRQTAYRGGLFSVRPGWTGSAPVWPEVRVGLKPIMDPFLGRFETHIFERSGAQFLSGMRTELVPSMPPCVLARDSRRLGERFWRDGVVHQDPKPLAREVEIIAGRVNRAAWPETMIALASHLVDLAVLLRQTAGNDFYRAFFTLYQSVQQGQSCTADAAIDAYARIPFAGGTREIMASALRDFAKSAAWPGGT